MGEEGTLTQVLSDLPRGQATTLGRLLAATGCRTHGVAILLLSIPEALPLPVPSAGAILGGPLILISAHLAVFGETESLPVRLRDRVLPGWLTDWLRDRVAPVLARAERLSRPRWSGLVRRERLLGIVCLYLASLLLLPLPFFNTPPALCLVLLAWGLVQRDGWSIGAGLAGTVALTVALVSLADWVRTMFA
ncbi:exopolysaccharide biosynthesis protein [uncultured Paracoccus sp.]|uniref:exopolysaccharide biosynthesis protein n=1 Tax=uncultured Paracoccus sp. TaxID=189685 RepID=UPI0026339388|nr:exopolysaccharide biosynthesis protein [uncultured Paracoccus sp.]